MVQVGVEVTLMVGAETQGELKVAEVVEEVAEVEVVVEVEGGVEVIVLL